MSELQQAYYNSMATYEYRSVQVPYGMFAVVESCTAYCPITDATLPGCDRYLHSLHGTRRIAEYYAKKRSQELDDYDEVGVEVLPKAVHPVQAITDDECPF